MSSSKLLLYFSSGPDLSDISHPISCSAERRTFWTPLSITDRAAFEFSPKLLLCPLPGLTSLLSFNPSEANLLDRKIFCSLLSDAKSAAANASPKLLPHSRHDSFLPRMTFLLTLAPYLRFIYEKRIFWFLLSNTDCHILAFSKTAFVFHHQA